MLQSEGITPVPWPAASNVTRITLLSRVRNPSDSAAWAEFESRYRDLLVRFCRRQGLQQADAEDVVQVVMSNLAKSLPRFAYDPARGRFRDYLYRCARNAISQWSSRPKGREVALDTGVEVALPTDAPGDAASVQGHREVVWSLAYSDDGALLASQSADGMIRIWDNATGRGLMTLTADDQGMVFPLAFIPSGAAGPRAHRLVTGHGYRGAAIWDFACFDRFIAGNAEYQVRRLEGSLSSDQLAATRRWTRSLAPDLPRNGHR